MSDSVGIVILAAGKGTRMKIDTPKALVQALGKPLLDYVLSSALEFANKVSIPAEVGVVVGHKKELLEQWWSEHPKKSKLKLAWQKEQDGTAGALRACFNDQPQFWQHKYTLIACADTPLISSMEFEKLFLELKEKPELVGVAAVFDTQNPLGYGRIVSSRNGFHIVEEKDATEEVKKIKTVNSGFYILKTEHLKKVLSGISKNNKAGEFYLTDLFQDQYDVKAVSFDSEEPFLGINNLEQLSHVCGILKARKLSELFALGVQFLNPKSIHIDDDVQIDSGSIIYPGVTLLGQTKIAQNVVVESGAFIRNSTIGNSAEILAYSYIDEANIEGDTSIGPMARIRPGTIIQSDCKIGNFVEVKKSKLEKGVKVSHLSYVGDAQIGEGSNIGCGFITCNYDGANKHKTIIGKNTFIGSDCQAIAPIEIGNDAFVAAGTTITKNVPDGAFAIARSAQVTKEGAAKKFLKSKKP